MAFGNYNYNPWAPNFYTPPVQNPVPQIPQAQQQQQADDRIWVPSQAAAEAYPITTPNTTVRLWDSSQPFFYQRQTDAQGRPFPALKYRYELVTDTPAPQAAPDQSIDARFTELENRLRKLESRNEVHNDEPTA